MNLACGSRLSKETLRQMPEFDTWTFLRLAVFKSASCLLAFGFILRSQDKAALSVFVLMLCKKAGDFLYHNDMNGIQQRGEHTENNVLKFCQIC